MKRLLALLALLALSVFPVFAQEQKNASDQGTPDKQFKRGATRTPANKIAEAMATGKATVFRHVKPSIPAQVTMVPPKLSYWGNNQYSDCVSAESAAAIAAYSTYVLGGAKQIFVTESTLISWARSHGVLNGADLLDVATSMNHDGIKDENGVLRKTGTPASVKFTDEPTLQAAIASGPISIAIAANSLPSGAGNNSGWYSFGSRNDHNTDHCVSLFGYGPAKVLFDALGVATPASAPTTTCYLLFTWNTIGVVDHKWITGTTDEAWLRTPTVVGIDPLPPDPVGLTIAPASASLAPGATQQFSATLIPAGQDSVVWSASGGGITASGLYTAPSQVGAYTVKASLLSNPAKFVTAPVVVSATPQPPGPGIVTSFIWSDGKKYNVVADGSPVVPADKELAPLGTMATLASIKAMLAKLGIEPAKDVPEPFKLTPKEPEKPEPKDEDESPAARAPKKSTPYDEQRKMAVKLNKPLLVGIECQPPIGPWLTCSVDYVAPWTDGYYSHAVIVTVPKDGDLWWKRTLPENVTRQTVELVLGK